MRFPPVLIEICDAVLSHIECLFVLFHLAIVCQTISTFIGHQRPPWKPTLVAALGVVVHVRNIHGTRSYFDIHVPLGMLYMMMTINYDMTSV